MSIARPEVDRARRIRRAFLELVAERGFHASMGAVAERAGVAAGTIYVHHASKEALITAVYRELKRDLGAAAIAGIDPTARPEHRFRVTWHNIFRHLNADPIRARFLVQVDASPYAGVAHAAAVEDGEDPLVAAAAAPDMAPLLAALPAAVLYDLGFGSAIRLAARVDGSSDIMDGPATERLIDACWRAITRDSLRRVSLPIRDARGEPASRAGPGRSGRRR
ncbi:MAG: TetR/AcrR family transcriptional regulator [Chloroflexi bacterium]|nr:TetR/AcrR family transcriptional regulator [Chloroflexota bacterium]